MIYVLIIIVLYLIISYVIFNFIFVSNKNKSFKLIDNQIEEILKPYRKLYDKALKWVSKQEVEHLKIKSFDNYDLNAIFIKNNNEKGIIILAHGYRSTKERDLYASLHEYYSLGYSLLVIEQRACGESKCKYITFGYNESKDLNRWINYIYKKTNSNNIIIGGISLGASSVLMVNNKHVKAIISDSAYANAYDEIKYTIKHYFHIPPFLFMWIINIYCKLFLKVNLLKINTLHNLARIHIPILFIHGSIDDFVPPENTIINYNCYKGKKDLLIIENASHGMGYLVDRNKYIDKLKSFLKDNKLC